MSNIKNGQKVKVIDYKGKEHTVYVFDDRAFDETSPMFESPVFEATDEHGNMFLARKEGMKILGE